MVVRPWTRSLTEFRVGASPSPSLSSSCILGARNDSRWVSRSHLTHDQLSGERVLEPDPVQLYHTSAPKCQPTRVAGKAVDYVLNHGTDEDCQSREALGNFLDKLTAWSFYSVAGNPTTPPRARIFVSMALRAPLSRVDCNAISCRGAPTRLLAACLTM